jgi:hypothetical protein
MSLMPVNSSSIRAVAYDGYHLFVQFHASPTIYGHPGVPYGVDVEFIHASSMGTYYNEHNC